MIDSCSSRSTTALKEYAAKESSDIDLSKFHFSHHALKQLESWKMRYQEKGSLPSALDEDGAAASAKETQVFGNMSYTELWRTTAGVPEGWTRVVFRQGSGAGAGRRRPCFLSPDRRWIWLVEICDAYLRCH